MYSYSLPHDYSYQSLCENQKMHSDSVDLGKIVCHLTQCVCIYIREQYKLWNLRAYMQWKDEIHSQEILCHVDFN